MVRVSRQHVLRVLAYPSVGGLTLVSEDAVDLVDNLILNFDQFHSILTGRPWSGEPVRGTHTVAKKMADRGSCPPRL